MLDKNTGLGKELINDLMEQARTITEDKLRELKAGLSEQAKIDEAETIKEYEDNSELRKKLADKERDLHNYFLTKGFSIRYEDSGIKLSMADSYMTCASEELKEAKKVTKGALLDLRVKLLSKALGGEAGDMTDIQEAINGLRVLDFTENND